MQRAHGEAKVRKISESHGSVARAQIEQRLEAEIGTVLELAQRGQIKLKSGNPEMMRVNRLYFELSSGTVSPDWAKKMLAKLDPGSESGTIQALRSSLMIARDEAELPGEPFKRKIGKLGRLHADNPNKPLDPKFVPQNQVLEVCLIDRDASNSAQNLRAKLSNGYYVVQQPSRASCGATCVAMLLLDKQAGKISDKAADNIRFTTYTNDARLLKMLQTDAKNATQSLVNSIDELQQLVNHHGPCIVPISDPVAGGHFIVVDQFNAQDNSVTIRDPWHGWRIHMTREYFVKIFDPNTVSYIPNPK
jgi:hypothetical protein